MDMDKAEKMERLRTFYAQNPPEKTQKQLEKLLRQQSWDTLCSKLRKKYGSDPDQMAAKEQKAQAPPAQESSPKPWDAETAGTSGIGDWQPSAERNVPLPPSASNAIAKEGTLEKQKSETEWKARHCELVVDDDEGARLVYRQKKGKRELGQAMLSGATLTHGPVGERASLLLVDAGGLEYRFGSRDHSVVSEWVNSLKAAMGMDDGDAAMGLDSGLQQTTAWEAPGQDKPSGPGSVSSVASAAVSVVAGEIVQAGNLDKQKDETWKQRYCELSIHDHEGARLVYRQKPGKRMMGIASLAGAEVSRSAVGERATFTLVDASGVEYTFGSADKENVEQWVTRIRAAMGTAPGGAPSPKPEPTVEAEPKQEVKPNLHTEQQSQRREKDASQEEVADDDFLRLEQQAVEEAESQGGVLSPPPPVSTVHQGASRPPPLPAKTSRGPGAVMAISASASAASSAAGISMASDFMASLVGDDDSPRSPKQATANPSADPSEGVPPIPDRSLKLTEASAESQPHVGILLADIEAMKHELAELRSSNAELTQSEREANEKSQKLTEANSALEQRAVAAETAALSANKNQTQAQAQADAAAIEAAAAPYIQEAERLREDIGKLRRELLSRTAQHEEIRGKMIEAAAERDAALANEQAAVESSVAERAVSQEALKNAQEAGESVAAQLREQLQEAEDRASAADAAKLLALSREKVLRDEHSVALEAINTQVERLEVERSDLQEISTQAEAEKARLLSQIQSSEKQHNNKIEELLHQVELWEAEANRLGAGANEKDAIVTQMRAEAEQLYNELSTLHQSADETHAELSNRARKAEAEVVRLRLQMNQIEDSAEDSVAGHEQESARHLAELRSEVSRLLLAESEAKDLVQTHASRVSELESQLAATQSSGTAAAEKLSSMESRAQVAEAASASRLTELRALEEKVVSLSAQLVSSSKESASSKAALEERLASAQHDNGKLVLELSSVRGELADFRSSAMSMTTAHGDKDKQLSAMTQDVLTLTQQIDELRQQLDSRDRVHAESTREQTEAFGVRIAELEAKLDEAQQETASALQRHSQVSEDLESTKLELSAATMRSAEAESAAEEADAQREASIEAERKAKAELQQSLAEIEQGTSEMEKLKQQNEDLVDQNKAYRNRLRAMPTSAFAFDRPGDSSSARFDPAKAFLRHGANVKAGRSRAARVLERDRPPAFEETMAKAGTILRYAGPAVDQRKRAAAVAGDAAPDAAAEAVGVDEHG